MASRNKTYAAIRKLLIEERKMDIGYNKVQIIKTTYCCMDF